MSSLTKLTRDAQLDAIIFEVTILEAHTRIVVDLTNNLLDDIHLSIADIAKALDARIKCDVNHKLWRTAYTVIREIGLEDLDPDDWDITGYSIINYTNSISRGK